MFRKTAPAVIVVLVFSASTFGQQWAEKMFSATSHDFGVVARGEKAEYAFVLENLYVEEVHIAGVRASCSCTKPEIQTPTLKTYEKGAILAKFNTSSFVGSKGATLTVTFDKPFFAEVQLQVRGYIRDDVMLSPGMVDFGEVDRGKRCEKEILVNHTGDDDWRIVTARCANPHLSATATEVSRSGGQVSYRVNVCIDQQAPTGYFVEHLVLATTDAEGQQVTIPVTGRVEPEISLHPGSLLMGLVEPGQKVTKQLVVRGRQPFQVSEVICDGRGFTAVDTSGESKKNVHLISVTYQAGQGTDKAEGKIFVRTTVGTSLHARVYAMSVSSRRSDGAGTGAIHN
jgi:hypothetical protein